jgi:hypothetical protein
VLRVAYQRTLGVWFKIIDINCDFAYRSKSLGLLTKANGLGLIRGHSHHDCAYLKTRKPNNQKRRKQDHRTPETSKTRNPKNRAPENQDITTPENPKNRKPANQKSPKPRRGLMILTNVTILWKNITRQTIVVQPNRSKTGPCFNRTDLKPNHLETEPFEN